MGALPQAGVWVRLEVAASSVGLGGKTITGMAFTLQDGQAWFDRAGIVRCLVPVAEPPTSLPSDTVWLDDQAPVGVTLVGTWNWDTTQKASGAQSHTEPAAAGYHQHYFYGASPGLSISSNDTLVTYVLINPCDPPREVMLQWFENGSWEHRAYWGANLIGAGYPMGVLPQAGVWVRLDVPASAVGLEGKTVTGMAFTLYDGQAWFDRAGKSAGSPPP